MRNLSKNTQKRIAKMKLTNKTYPEWLIDYYYLEYTRYSDRMRDREISQIKRIYKKIKL